MIRASKYFLVLAVVAAPWMVGCSSDGGGESTTTVTDTGASGGDTSVAPTDTGSSSDDTGGTTSDTGTTVADTGGTTTDTGGTTTDSGTAGDAEGDAAPPVDCTGKPDGTECGGGNICRAGACAPSSCGDGFIDKTKGEECEDGNSVSGDGCSACKYDCKADTDCNDSNECTADTCDKSTAGKQLCKSVAVAGTPACTLADGGAGACKAGVCAKAGCGNGTVDTGEECDDGNADNADGCTTSCKYSCKVDGDCDDGNKCNGAETCNTTTHKCVAGTAVSCAAAGCATAGTCDPTTGACSYGDLDKDGVTCEKDCNDADPTVFPGAYECKDGKDNDCSAATADSTAPDCLCYIDPDKDGYAIATATTISSAGACPDGYTRRKPVAGDATTLDCRESNANVSPAQTGWFTSQYCSVPTKLGGCLTYSWDYNCSGAIEKQYNDVSTVTCPSATTFKGCVLASGWVGAAPDCNKSGTWRQCTWSTLTGKCTGTETARTQGCH